MSQNEIDEIQARLDGERWTENLSRSDVAALLAEVKRLTAEREGFRQAAVTIREQRDVAQRDLAAVLANRPTAKEARDE